MSIGIYAFLRIYFFCFGLSDFARFRTRCPPSSVPPPVRSTRRGLSGIECRSVQRVQRPGVCVGAWRGMPCIWHGLPCCLFCAVYPGALEWQGRTGGVYNHRPASPGQSRHHRKNKKGSKKSPPPPLPIPKILPKNKKTPTKGLCSVLYLPYKP